MRILLDENLDVGFAEFLPGRDVAHVSDMGWQGVKNGQLLTFAEEARFDVFITADKNLSFQQNLKRRSLCVIVLDIHPNVLVNQAACTPLIEERLPIVAPGEVHLIEGPHSRRRDLS
jgi:predicted nuclease of predicted toxin-antitoxin system